MEYWGISDIIRAGYCESETVIRRRILARKLPPHIKIGGKIKWKASAIRAWFNNQSIVWIPRRDK